MLSNRLKKMLWSMSSKALENEEVTKYDTYTASTKVLYNAARRARTDNEPEISPNCLPVILSFESSNIHSKAKCSWIFENMPDMAFGLILSVSVPCLIFRIGQVLYTF